MKRLSTVALIALAALAIHANALAAGDAAVAFSPSAASATAGSTVAVDVTIANIDASPGLANYDLTLRWDPAVVRLDSLKDTSFITSGDNVVVCATGAIDNTGGSVEAQCQAIPLSGAPGVSTSGPIALLHGSFLAVAAGTSSLTLSGTLAGPSGAPIPATFAGGSIHVSAASSSSPTVAPSATATQPASATPTSALTATATSIPVTSSTAAATASAETVTLPDTGEGVRQSTLGMGHILIALAAAAALAVSIGLVVRQSWRSHTRNR